MTFAGNDHMKNKHLWIFALVLPYLLIVAYIVGLLLSIAIGKYNFAISGSILAIPILAAAITLIYIYKRDTDVLSESFPLVPFRQRTLVLLFGIAFSMTIILGLLCPVRSSYFLCGIIALYTIILLQIFSKGYRSVIMLIEIMLVMACLIYETTLKYPYYFGWTDIIPHNFIATVTYLSGHIIPYDLSGLSGGYAYFPLYHIWIALNSYMLAIDIKSTLFIVTCPVYIMVVVFLYYLFKRATGNIQISLLACLLYSIDSTVTFYGTYMITRAAAYVGFAIILYLLIFREERYNYNKQKNVIFRALAILITIFIMLVHQVSTPQILFLLLLLTACEWVVGSVKYLRNTFLIFEAILFLTYWLYVAFNFTRYIFITRISLDVLSTPLFIESQQLYSPLAFLFNNVDTLIFLYFAIIGITYLFWRQKPTYAPVFGLFALLTIVFYVPNPIMGLWQTMTLFRFDRFMLFISPFMALAMAWGLYTASGYLQKIIPVRAVVPIILVLFVIYCFEATGIITTGDPTLRVSFTSEELYDLDHIQSNIIPNGSIIYSDYYTSRYFSQVYFSESDTLGLPFYRNQIIRNITDIPLYQGFIIIPYNQFMNYGLALSKGNELNPGEGGTYPYLPSNETISALSNNLARKNKIYSSEFIEIHH